MDLLIIVDSSTSETKACKALKEDCLDIIILDHHPKTEDNPYALIVNPQLDNYPSKELSGGGVVYKTIQVLDDFFSTDYHEEYIDLCGMALYADIMSMREPENRYYVYQALKHIRNPGLLAILKVQNINPQYVDSSTIGYKLAPCVNAVARMDQIEKIIELLLEDDYEKCLVLAKECVKLNEDRKKLESKLFKKVKDKLDLSHNIIILKTTDDDKIDKGFNGLIATKIADRYKKPCLVVNCKNGTCAGSGRSINNIPLKTLLNKTNLLNWSNGHESAFGLSFKEENIEEIYEALEDKIINNEEKIIDYDLVLEPNEINFDLVRHVSWFNYLAGKNVETTKVRINGLPIRERRVMGKNIDTVKLSSDDIYVMKFRTNEYFGIEIEENMKIDVVGTLNTSYDFGLKKKVIQIFAEDFKLSEDN